MNIERCNNAKHYKAVYYPRCNGGNPCHLCMAKWREKHFRYPNEILRPNSPSRRRLKNSASVDTFVAWMMKGFYRIT